MRQTGCLLGRLNLFPRPCRRRNRSAIGSSLSHLQLVNENMRFPTKLLTSLEAGNALVSQRPAAQWMPLPSPLPPDTRTATAQLRELVEREAGWLTASSGNGSEVSLGGSNGATTPRKEGNLGDNPQSGRPQSGRPQSRRPPSARKYFPACVG